MLSNIKYISIERDNIRLIRVKLKETPNRYRSSQGEVDIFIDGVKHRFFDIACVQTEDGRILSPMPVNNFSWHGFYDARNEKVRLPVINFKSDREKAYCHRHNGTINQKDIFLFPICSIYVPKNMDLLSLKTQPKNDLCCHLPLDRPDNARVDLFVLPRGISFELFVSHFSISLFYLCFDIGMFNKCLKGELLELPVHSREDITFKSVNINGWDVLVRIIYYEEETREPDLCKKYSILFHDPNDAIEMILNRTIAYPYDDNHVEMYSLRERHLMEMQNFDATALESAPE